MEEDDSPATQPIRANTEVVARVVVNEYTHYHNYPHNYLHVM